MIFVTVGTQLPFPRLIDAIDHLAVGLDEKIIAQTGTYDGVTQNIEGHETLEPLLFEKYFKQARIIIAHAGIGSILSAKRYTKPIVLFPRSASLGEHRNDHQIATAKEVGRIKGVYVAWTEDDLEVLLRRMDLEPADDVISPSREALIGCLKNFIQQE